MSNRVPELNETYIQDGPVNVCWLNAKIIEEFKPKEAIK